MVFAQFINRRLFGILASPAVPVIGADIPPSPGMGGYGGYWQLIWGLVAFAAIMALLFFVLRWISKHAPASGKGGRMRVLDRLSVTRDVQIAVVEIYGRYLVVSASKDGAGILCELSKEEYVSARGSEETGGVFPVTWIFSKMGRARTVPGGENREEGDNRPFMRRFFLSFREISRNRLRSVPVLGNFLKKTGTEAASENDFAEILKKYSDGGDAVVRESAPSEDEAPETAAAQSGVTLNISEALGKMRETESSEESDALSRLMESVDSRKRRYSGK